MYRRSLDLESLSPRQMLAVDSLPWSGASSLRLSFAPDGTDVGGEQSSLVSTFASSANADHWQATIAKAFAIWAEHANINVGIVPDNGSPLGAVGMIRGDTRFGELRVAGVPMTNDTWAASIDHRSTAVGTWSGELLFNTAADWNLPQEDLLKIVVHEAGHILGLPHSDDVNSPMFIHGIPSTVVPAATDIALLQEMYGTRPVDFNERENSNDYFDRATRIRLPSNATPSVDKPLAHFGEIRNPGDVDYFVVDAGDFSSQALTLRVASQGLSQLQYRVTLLDRDQVVLATVDAINPMGNDVELELELPSSSDRLYVRLEPIGNSLTQRGSYVVSVENTNVVYPDWSERLGKLQAVNRWFASSADTLVNFDITTLFDSSGSLDLPSDAGIDDDLFEAPRVDADTNTSLQQSFVLIAGIDSATDTDYYRVRTEQSRPDMGLHIQLLALQADDSLPDLRILDPAGAPLPFQTVVNGNGVLELWLPNVLAEEDYVVGIGPSDNLVGFNYELVATFREPLTAPPINVMKTVSPASTSQLDWFVARPQLFSFSLDLTTVGSQGDGSVFVAVSTEADEPVAHWTAPIGQLSTVEPLLLEPGRYKLELTTDSTKAVPFKLVGDTEIDPLGPKPKPKTNPIYSCPNEPEMFCYPNQPPSKQPVLIVAPIGPPRRFHNPDQPTDANNDGDTTTLDILIIVNAINQHGTGSLTAMTSFNDPQNQQVDVNGDGSLSTIDILLVVNRLNAKKGEGEHSGSLVDEAFPGPLPGPFVDDLKDDAPVKLVALGKRPR